MCLTKSWNKGNKQSKRTKNIKFFIAVKCICFIGDENKRFITAHVFLSNHIILINDLLTLITNLQYKPSIMYSCMVKKFGIQIYCLGFAFIVQHRSFKWWNLGDKNCEHSSLIYMCFFFVFNYLNSFSKERTSF